MYLDGYAVRHMLREEVRVWNINLCLILDGDVLQDILEALHQTLGTYFCRRGEINTMYCK